MVTFIYMCGQSICVIKLIMETNCTADFSSSVMFHFTFVLIQLYKLYNTIDSFAKLHFRHRLTFHSFVLNQLHLLMIWYCRSGEGEWNLSVNTNTFFHKCTSVLPGRSLLSDQCTFTMYLQSTTLVVYHTISHFFFLVTVLRFLIFFYLTRVWLSNRYQIL